LQFFAQAGLRAGGGSVLGRTSLTTHCREWTLTSWPCSGGLAAAVVMRASWRSPVLADPALGAFSDERRRTP
jgi:hypothetical protein